MTRLRYLTTYVISNYTLDMNLLLKTNYIWLLTYVIWDKVVLKSSFLAKYYNRNENLWQDGFLFDFLQKKTIDSWLRRFVIYTGFIFSERLLYDYVIRFYLDNLVWILHNYSITEPSNVSEVLTTILFIYFSILLLIFALTILI